jgi:site-specific DNA-methyltransferase (adenine-specific)
MLRIEPTWQRGDASLYLGDCLDILPQLETGSVDAVVTDPPYGVEAAKWDGRMPHELVTDCLRIAKSTVVWFGSASNAVLDAQSFPVRPDRMMIWAPKFTLLKIAKDGFAYRFHPIWWWRIRKQKTVPWDVFNEKTECGNWWKHKCTKPVALMSKIVSAATLLNESILDPFLGSGTTGVACVQTGRRFIGVELDAGYFEIAVKRIEAAMQQGRLL